MAFQRPTISFTRSDSTDQQTFLTGREITQEDSRCANPGLSDSMPSDEGSIYDAVRASSGAEDYSRTHSGFQMNDLLDSGVAANMAMFIPLTPDLKVSHSGWPVQKSNHCIEQKTKAAWWHSHLLSDNYLPSSMEGDKDLGIPLAKESSQTADGLRHRRVVSLNDADDSSHMPSWPGDRMSPVHPVLPRYPPPVRSPTPPGLPSFGTQEAIYYTAHFFVRSSNRDGQTQQQNQGYVDRNPHGHPANGIGTGSHGETLRRLFGFSPRTPVPPARPVYSIARAEDGTAVQGRFPYRQSGHGMNLARRIDDHPFHRRAFTIAECDADVGDTAVVHDGQPSREPCGTKPRCSNQVGPLDPCAHHTLGSHPQTTSTVLPSVPKPAVTARPRRLTSAAALLCIHNGLSLRARASRLQTTRPSQNVNRPGTQSVDEAVDLPRCSPAPLQSTESPRTPNRSGIVHEKTGTWFQSLKIAKSCVCCCLRARGKYDEAIYTNSSNDTYTTAMSWAENNTGESQINTDANCQTQCFGQWCSNMWITVHDIASRNI